MSFGCVICSETFDSLTPPNDENSTVALKKCGHAFHNVSFNVEIESTPFSNLSLRVASEHGLFDLELLHVQFVDVQQQLRASLNFSFHLLTSILMIRAVMLM